MSHDAKMLILGAALALAGSLLTTLLQHLLSLRMKKLEREWARRARHREYIVAPFKSQEEAVTWLKSLGKWVPRRKREAAREAASVANKKADLIAQMGSQVQDVAIAAAEELRRQGWLTDGSLRGANLDEADLSRANLSVARLFGAHLNGAHLNGAHLERADLSVVRLFGAHLNGAHLERADLTGAYLIGANLSGANLIGAYLHGAHLGRADLSGANLIGANLSMADLRGANLGGANLYEANLIRAGLSKANLSGAYLFRANLGGANLSMANLSGAFLSEDTTLPDGTKWTPDTDMARFTDPSHPDFWHLDFLRPDAPA